VKFGVVYPQTELAGDAAAVGKFAKAVEQQGFDHLLMYDHVLGAEQSRRDPPLLGPYGHEDPFHDPLVTFGYLAALTKRIELVTGLLVLGQRQSVLVARQAADVELFSSGRLRLGVGVGWNYVEYEALGVDFRSRGQLMDEQIELLRRLWQEPLVQFDGSYHRVERAALCPRPAATIPIWVGGFSEPAFVRGAHHGDGFIFAGDLEPNITALARVRELLRHANRPTEGFGLELVMSRAHAPEVARRTAERWAELGGTHVSATTMGLGLDGVEAHVDYVHAVSSALKVDRRA